MSDDITIIEIVDNKLVGRAPVELSGLIQLHGCGLLNVKDLMGHQSYLPSSEIQIVIKLDPDIQYETDPLKVDRCEVVMIDLKIPQITIPIPSKRNLPLIIELLVREEIAKKWGYNPCIEMTPTKL